MKHNPFITNGLSIGFGLLFLFSLVGQAFSGLAYYNEQQVASKLDEIGLLQYVTSSSFVVDVAENWQSEYLQFLLFIIVTVWLVQRGSSESKETEKPGLESDAEQKVGRHADHNSPPWARYGDWRTTIYSNSLMIVMALVFFASWFAQSVSGWTVFNDEARTHGAETVSWLGYVGSSDFWEATFQNWQSEFLAVGSFAVIAIYLRQRGSPESKPVGAPTSDATGSEG